MAVWVVRGGRAGEYEGAFLEKGVVSIGFGLKQSIADFDNREALRASAEGRSDADQLWRFYHEIENDDLVVLPRKRSGEVAVGRITGAYAYQPDAVGQSVPHVRPVQWQVTDIPRSHFNQDLLNSFGAQQTLTQPRAPDAETRIDHAVSLYLGDTLSDTLEIGYRTPDDDEISDAEETTSENSGSESDLDREVIDRIIARLRRQFPGHRLEELVASILRSLGYYVRITREGADGGIDVLAGKGDMGFDAPSLCVQVKGRTSPVGLAEYSSLQGNIVSFNARHGLIVSLGGFTKPVQDRNEQQSFFQIRLWGPEDLAHRLLVNYADLPQDIRSDFRSDIPLGTLQILRTGVLEL